MFEIHVERNGVLIKANHSELGQKAIVVLLLYFFRDKDTVMTQSHTIRDDRPHTVVVHSFGAKHLYHGGEVAILLLEDHVQRTIAQDRRRVCHGGESNKRSAVKSRNKVKVSKEARTIR